MPALYVIDNMEIDDLKKELLGKTIIEIDEKNSTITLDDGRILQFDNTQECCAWFNAELKTGNLVNNTITNITDTGDPEWKTEYTIHVLAEDTRVVDIAITGDHGTGYYCQSIDLIVWPPNKK